MDYEKSTILLFTCMLLLLCACTVKYADVLRANWGLVLPENAGLALVYEKDSGESFHGDGVRFSVQTDPDSEPVEIGRRLYIPTAFGESHAFVIGQDHLGYYAKSAAASELTE